MGLLDRLFGGRRRPEARDPRTLTGSEALARWRYLVLIAPPEVLVAAHGDGLAGLGAEAQVDVLHRVRTALSALEPGAVVPREVEVLVRAAARAERRAPGFLERALSTDAPGRRALTTLASAVVATVVAAPFLRDFDPSLSADALAARRGPDFEGDGDPAPDLPGATHDDGLDDED